jgi:hypothetical protein
MLVHVAMPPKAFTRCLLRIVRASKRKYVACPADTTSALAEVQAAPQLVLSDWSASAHPKQGFMSMQIVGRVKGAASTPPTTAAAALLAAAEAAGGGGNSSSAGITDAAAATAALLASPRHSLRTPRARVSEQQVELAMVESGDILGKDTGYSCNTCSVVLYVSWAPRVCTTHITRSGLLALLLVASDSRQVGWTFESVCLRH